MSCADFGLTDPGTGCAVSDGKSGLREYPRRRVRRISFLQDLLAVCVFPYPIRFFPSTPFSVFWRGFALPHVRGSVSGCRSISRPCTVRFRFALRSAVSAASDIACRHGPPSVSNPLPPCVRGSVSNGGYDTVYDCLFFRMHRRSHSAASCGGLQCVFGICRHAAGGSGLSCGGVSRRVRVRGFPNLLPIEMLHERVRRCRLRTAAGPETG